MKKALTVFFWIGILLSGNTMAQRADMLKANESKLVYPMFKGSYLSGVMPVEGVTMPYASKGNAKMVFDFEQSVEDPSKINAGIEEVMRIINLHVAAGVPKEKIDAVVVFHGPGAPSFLNDEAFNNRFKKGNNPNLPLIQQMKDKGVKFVVCGQTLAFRDMKIEAFPSGIIKAYSAKSALTDLQTRGYSLFNINGGH